MLLHILNIICEPRVTFILLKSIIRNILDGIYFDNSKCISCLYTF